MKKTLLLFIVCTISISCSIHLFRINTDNTRSTQDDNKKVILANLNSELNNKVNKENEEIQRRKENKLKIQEDYFNSIQSYLDNLNTLYGNKIGISYYDINSQKELSINGDTYFTAASTSKVPLNMLLMNKAYNNEINLSDTFNYIPNDFETGTGILQGKDLSQPLQIDMLSEYSIKYSDNIATNMLYRLLGGFNTVYEDWDNILGYKTTHAGNVISPKDATNYLKILYNNPDNNPYYANLIDYMKNTVFDQRLSLNIKDKQLVAHKIGSYGSYINDIGIIYAKNPFIISVYTNNLPNSENVIAEISEFIFNKQNYEYFK